MGREPKSYFEPWFEEPRRIDIAPVDVSHLSADDAAEVNAMLARAAETQDYTVWGSNVWPPGPTVGLLGGKGYSDGRTIVLTVRKAACPDEKAVTPRDMARRIRECVNACRSVVEPSATLDGVRSLLRDLSLGDADAGDPRVVALLARMIPPEEVLKYHTEGE